MRYQGRLSSEADNIQKQVKESGAIDNEANLLRPST